MGVCISLCRNPSNNTREVQVNPSNKNNANKGVSKGLKRKKTKFPKKGEVFDDDDDEEINDKNKKDENKNDEKKKEENKNEENKNDENKDKNEEKN